MLMLFCIFLHRFSFLIYTINGIAISLSPLYIRCLSILVIYLPPYSIFSVLFLTLFENPSIFSYPVHSLPHPASVSIYSVLIFSDK